MVDNMHLLTNRKLPRSKAFISVAFIIFMGGAAAATVTLNPGCSLINKVQIEENTDKECSNEMDDDLDGLADCADPECAEFENCREKTDEKCSDLMDNDFDGRIDCMDPDCSGIEHCREDSSITCSDGADNDLDGAEDCEDMDCNIMGLCNENDDSRCTDEIDNDGDGSVDCGDVDCFRKIAWCNPADYSEIIFEDTFDTNSMNIDWFLYDYTTGHRSFDDVSIGDGTFHVQVAGSVDSDPEDPVREEKGVYSSSIFFLWNSITNIVIDASVPDNDTHIPALIALSMESSSGKPFLRAAAEPEEARHDVLFVKINGLGGVQICSRKKSSESDQCTPASGPMMPQEDIPSGSQVRYQISLDKSEIILYQNMEERIRMGNPFRPGIARLFLVASTDRHQRWGWSEMSVDSVQIYQVKQGRLIYESSFDSDPGWETHNPENCHFNERGSMEVTCVGASEEVCYTTLGENIAEKTFQMRYDFEVVELDWAAPFQPGLWEPAMHFDLGMSFSAGIGVADQGELFTFRSCDKGDSYLFSASSTPGLKLNILSGHDMESNFSYALYLDGESGRELWHTVIDETVCYILLNFGFTVKDYHRYGPVTSHGYIDNVIIEVSDEL